ncbi:MAG: OpgC domain-containing protein [Pseudomonadota bacterium]
MREASRYAPAAAQAATAQGRKPRDLRLDFFRGIAMFIILLAHTPGNTWTLWIPARFGFSDATEIFVFCSGMASSLAFGASFRTHGFGVGTARIAFRVWQVYWCHIGMFLAILALLWTADAQGWGDPEKVYVGTLPIVPFFEETGPALIGMLTLTWVPNYFDILPMYLVILAMVPLVMAAHRIAGLAGAAALVGGVWLATQFGWADLPSRPWRPDIPWFFNPFGWQLVFFTGFFLGMGWVKAPPVSRPLLWLAAAAVLLTIPFAWFQIHGARYIPDAWLLHDWIADGRQNTRFFWRKTEQGLFRWAHFLALAYLAWAWVGPEGRKLREGFAAPGAASRAWLWAAGIVAVATLPWAYLEEIKHYSPALDAASIWLIGDGARALLGFDLFVPGERIGLLQLAHLIAMLVLIWAAIGPRRRAWLVGPGFLAAVPVIRKVGTQSLAVFLTSMILARATGIWLDVVERTTFTTATANLAGFAILIAAAYGVGWFRAQPWRRKPAAPAEAAARTAGAAPAPRAGGALSTPAE